jgi:excisionase family DNA binding protein
MIDVSEKRKLGAALNIELPAEVLEAIAERAAVLLREQVSTPSDRWLGTKAAADYLGCSTGRLHNLTSAGRIPHHHEGGRLVFSTSEIDEWIRSGRAAP